MNQTYDLVRSEDAAYRLYEIRTIDGHDEVRALEERVDAYAGPRGVHESGDFYELPAGDFHTSALLSMDAITVVIGKLTPGGRDLSLGDPDILPSVRQREHYDAERSVELARHLLARVSPAVPAS